MLKIAVCDDEKNVTSEIEEKIYSVSTKLNVIVEVDVFFDGKTFVDYMINQNVLYDIIYIDIEMEGQNGVDTARDIRKFDKNVLLIYVTNYESFAKEVFEVSAYRFLTKPVDENLFEKYFCSAINEIKSTPKYFHYQFNKVQYRISIDDIIYFQSDKRLTYINMGNDMRKCYEKLNSIEKILQSKGIFFYRTHQSFLVNPKYVDMYMYDTMRLQDGTILSISENRRKNVSELFCQLKGDSIVI